MYKVGQRVKVVNDALDAYGMIGEIVSVDETWPYPYEINFQTKHFKQDLYGHSDIQIYIGTENNKTYEEKQLKFINESINELITLIDNEIHTRENALAITKLQEAQMWYSAGKKINNE